MRSIIVFGLGLGDEGKGATVDALVRQFNFRTVVRFNGGPQAAHHVVLPDGRWLCFSQFSSGTLYKGTRTWLSRFMLVEPISLLNEVQALIDIGVHNPLKLLCIDAECVVITPFHKHLNRLSERLLAKNRHGSCGIGVGCAWKDHLHPARPSLYYKDLQHLPTLIRKLMWIRAECIDRAEQLVERNDCQMAHKELQHMYDLDIKKLIQIFLDVAQNRGIQLVDSQKLSIALQREAMIFEGAQGVLLDPEYGFSPHITKTRTTPKNAHILLKEAQIEDSLVLGVTRSYSTRHGAGPFPTEEPSLEKYLPEEHNLHNIWQGKMRVGWLDRVLLTYALQKCGRVDGLALTHIDRYSSLPHKKICLSYTHHKYGDLKQLPSTVSTEFLYGCTQIKHNCSSIEELIDFLPKPVLLRSFGKSHLERTQLALDLRSKRTIGKGR